MNFPQVRRDYLAWTPAEKDPKENGVIIIPQHGIAGHQDLVDSALLRAPGSSEKGGSSAPVTPPPEREVEVAPAQVPAPVVAVPVGKASQ